MQPFGRRHLLKMAAGVAAGAASALFLRDQTDSAPAPSQEGEVVSLEYNGIASEHFVSAWDFGRDGEPVTVTLISTPSGPNVFCELYRTKEASFPQYDQRWKVERAFGALNTGDYEWVP